MSIEITGLSKRFGRVLAVDDLSFRVVPGRVTGFLGPNGAGKTTTLRLILGLDMPTAGQATVAGRRYRDLVRPLHHVGALLDAGAVHGGRTAWTQLLSLARSNGIGRSRVAEMLRLTGLEAVRDRRLAGFSLGMRQRLGIAAALLGDPGVLLFDEPLNGLDTEGIAWLRGLFKALAAEGRTVLVSSHLMAEMAVTVDHLVIIGQGRLLADTAMDTLLESRARHDVLIRSPRADELTSLLAARGARVDTRDGSLVVAGMAAAAIGDLAAARGIALHELTPRHASLEEVYLDITRDSVEYRTGA